MKTSRKRNYPYPRRLEVLDFVGSHGPVTRAHVAGHLGMSYGQAVYHLRVLRRDGAVRRKKTPTGRLLYAIALAPRVAPEELERRMLSDPRTTSGRILEAVRYLVGPSLSRIGRELGITPGHVSYHVKRLEKAGLVYRATAHKRAVRVYAKK